MRISDWSSDVCSSDLQFFTPSSAGHPEHRAFAHTSEAGQEALHLRRIHIHAATDDHVLGTADQLEIAVRCPTGEVASPQPPVPDGRGRDVWVSPISPHAMSWTDGHLARTALRHRRPGHVSPVQLYPRTRSADTPDAP